MNAGFSDLLEAWIRHPLDESAHFNWTTVFPSLLEYNCVDSISFVTRLFGFILAGCRIRQAPVCSPHGMGFLGSTNLGRLDGLSDCEIELGPRYNRSSTHHTASFRVLLLLDVVFKLIFGVLLILGSKAVRTWGRDASRCFLSRNLFVCRYRNLFWCLLVHFMFSLLLVITFYLLKNNRLCSRFEIFNVYWKSLGKCFETENFHPSWEWRCQFNKRHAQVSVFSWTSIGPEGCYGT